MDEIKKKYYSSEEENKTKELSSHLSKTIQSRGLPYFSMSHILQLLKTKELINLYCIESHISWLVKNILKDPSVQLLPKVR